MHEIIGNIFDPKWNADVICVTTNGMLNNKGHAIMGKGIAAQFVQLFPDLPKELGKRIKSTGNHVYVFTCSNARIASLPTKEDWRDPSPIELVESSLRELVQIINYQEFNKILLPRPGCGNGKRDWLTEIKPICEKFLDDRFYIIKN